ncbi:MAG: YbjQ family protein [Bacteroidales bacterium]|nr:YbjQ family protein [Bacteroidales bacterium]
MKLFSIENIPGQNFEALGIVKGTIVQSKHIGRDFMASLKTIVGGEISQYTEMLVEARDIATRRMIAEAEALGADAIVGIRFSTSAVMQNAAEVIAFGTAVKFK